MSCFRKPDRPSHFAPNSNFFFRHNLLSVKIGNLCSVSQAPFRFHSIVSVQRQHGKTGAQVNHVVVFSQCTYRGPVLSEMFRYYRWLYYIHQYKGQFCNTVPSVSLFKVPNDESPAVYVHKVTSITVRNNLHLFVNKHVVCLTWVFAT